MTSMFVLVFGKYNESQDIECDYNDENQTINYSVSENLKLLFLKIKFIGILTL